VNLSKNWRWKAGCWWRFYREMERV